jgi:hypothetical protein
MGASRLDNVIGHWSVLIESFEASPLAFYQSVEAALARREVPQTRKSRVEHKEGGLFSASREYLRIEREKLFFDVCAAPFGTGFFVSSWLVESLPELNIALKALAVFALLGVTAWLLSAFGLIVGALFICVLLFGGLALAQAAVETGQLDDGYVRVLPFIGWVYLRFFKPPTYYRIDSMEMFQKAVHSAVLEVIDAMTAEKGLRALAESERKPVMRAFYDRKNL